MDEFQSVGFTKKATGIKGFLKIAAKDEYLEDVLKADILFLNLKGKNVPFFVEKQQINNGLTIKFEDVNDRNAATTLSGKEILLRRMDIIPDEDREFEVEESLQFQKYTGFEIIDNEMGALGELLEVVEYPQQEMAIVAYKEGEVLIPLHKNLIEKIDESNRIIFMNLPEGLLDL